MLGKKDFDLIVVGGGTAGAFSAIAAAREGVSVAVVERGTCLGGLAVNSGLTEMNAASFHSTPLYHGIEGEIFDNLISSGHAAYHFAVPMSSNKAIKIDRLRYDPEALKLLLEKLAVQAGVTLFYQTELACAQEGETSCTIKARGLYQEIELSAKYLIDATGNASLVRVLGGQTEAAEEKSRMIASLMFRISNVDMPQLQDFISSPALGETIKKGREDGVLKGALLAFSPIPGTKDVSLNVTRAKFNHEDLTETTSGILELRSQIEPVFRFVKQHVSGMDEAYISNIASVPGVRDARRIKGVYRLALRDLQGMVKFQDRVACGCYPVDFHDPVTNTVKWLTLPGVYYIPYRSLLPVGLRRTMVAGKCLCADSKAFAAVRVMPIVMNIGESAGYAAALASRKGKNLPELPITDLQDLLGSRYHA